MGFFCCSKCKGKAGSKEMDEDRRRARIEQEESRGGGVAKVRSCAERGMKETG